MRLRAYQVHNLAADMVEELQKRGLVRLLKEESEAVALVENAITSDFDVEKKLDEEVGQILKTYEREIEAGRMDYKTMFDLVKKKLVRERGLIL